jgi:hypothetical protein
LAEKPGLKKVFSVALYLPKFFADNLYHSLQKRGIIKNQFEDVVVVSYPKSGRTWLHVMLDYLHIHCQYKHDSANVMYMPDKDFTIDIDKDHYKNKRIIFLIRDPRDIIVSSYFQAVKRQENVFEGSVSEFVRDPKLGIEKLIDFQKTWINHSNVFNDFIVVTYEDLKTNTEQVLQDIVTFLNAKHIGHKRIKRAVKLFRFENMQLMEKSKILKMRYGKPLKPGKNGDENSLKVRKGKIKGYKDTLSTDDIEYCNRMINEKKLNYYMT